MPQQLKFVAAFRGLEGYGWTETHYKMSSGDTPALRTQLDSYFNSVVPARVGLLGEDCALVGVRVSYPRAGAVASLGSRQYFPGVPGQPGAAAQLSLAINFIDTTNTRSKIVHLRGFWDAVEKNESYHPEAPEAAGWENNLVTWKQALIQGGYGWPSTDVNLSVKGNAVNYVQNDDGTVTLTLQAPGMPTGTVGTVQNVRFARLNRSNSLLNRQMLVGVVDRTHVTTIQQHAVGPFQSGGTFNFRFPSFVNYFETGSISIGRRAMGRPLFRAPGRARAKPLT